jgi:hypothetical protein
VADRLGEAAAVLANMVESALVAGVDDGELAGEDRC